MNDQADNRPIHLYFDRYFNIADCKIEFQTIMASFPRKIVFCNNWTELAELLKLKPLSIAFSESELKYGSAVEIVNMVNTLAKLSNIDYIIPIAVAVTKKTTSAQLKDLQKSGVHGILPFHTEFGVELFDNFFDLNKDNYTISESNNFVGNHAVAIVGYNLTDKVLIAKNSFGVDWGLNGYFYIPFSYADKHIFERWIFNISKPNREGNNSLSPIYIKNKLLTLSRIHCKI